MAGMRETKVLDKRFRIQVGSLFDCSALKLALIRALKAEGIKIDLSGWSLDDGEIGDIGFIVNAALGLLGDEGLEKALMTLGEKNCLIGEEENAVKVNNEFFEPVENRKYFYPVMGMILKENLAPFFDGLSLGSFLPSDLIEKVQKLTSQQKS